MALKISSADIAHKSDVGGVALGLEGDAAVTEAAGRILAGARAARPEARIEGLVVAPMRRGGVELFVGVLRDPNAEPDAPLTPLAGVTEVPALLEGFTSAGGPLPRLHVDGDLSGLPVEVSTSGYRVVMEALTNIRQHAPRARAVRAREAWSPASWRSRGPRRSRP